MSMQKNLIGYTLATQTNGGYIGYRLRGGYIGYRLRDGLNTGIGMTALELLRPVAENYVVRL